jgi:hypothetical protein
MFVDILGSQCQTIEILNERDLDHAAPVHGAVRR